MTLDHAEHIVGSGAADMVSMVRALIADPELVSKALAGEEELVRPCIGSNFGCVGQLMSVGRMGCVVNTSVGFEASGGSQETASQSAHERVLVIGGGPAGLEAARVFALRGDEVTLIEAARNLGGQVAIASSAPHRQDLSEITRWLEAEAVRLGVTIRRGVFADPELVAEFGADTVVIATGSVPRKDGFSVATPMDPLPGFDLPHVSTSWDVFGFGGRVKVGKSAVVLDDTGTFEAISVAEKLLEHNCHVTLVTRFDRMGANVPYPPATVLATQERLMSGNFDLIVSCVPREITPNEVIIGSPFADRVRHLSADLVVHISVTQPQRDLANALNDLGIPVHIIGDAAGGNGIQKAIRDATQLGKVL